jgi:hypothetical protein
MLKGRASRNLVLSEGGTQQVKEFVPIPHPPTIRSFFFNFHLSFCFR